MTVTGITGTIYTLESTPLGSGGEGDVYSVEGMDKVAKVYKPNVLTDELAKKLVVMLDNPPSETALAQVAWPVDLVDDANGNCCGFIMPRLSINTELGDIYKYPSTLPISSHQKINIAQNICVVISEVHKAGYVFGDFNPRNIGLDVNTGLVSFLDTDTYHVVDMAKDKVYRCNVCAPGYAAPELLEKCSDYVASTPTASKNAYAQTPLPTFTKETDNFALAIHIFKLLMNGYTPFGGIIETASVSQSSPGIGDSAVRRDSYCFKPGYKHQSAAIMPLEALPQEMADMFTRAFILGKVDPRQRPNSVEWYGALERYEQSLVTCSDNPLHQYDRKNNECPLCEADRFYVEAVGASVPIEPSLKQSTYKPPPDPAIPKVLSIPVQTPMQITGAIPLGRSGKAKQQTVGNIPSQEPLLNRQFLKTVSLLLIAASILIIAFHIYDVIKYGYYIGNISVFIYVYVIIHLFIGIMGISLHRKVAQTGFLRIIAITSIIINVFIFAIFLLNITMNISWVIVRIVVPVSLSIMFFVAAVKDEDYMANAPGSLLLKATGIWSITIVTVFFSFPLFLSGIIIIHKTFVIIYTSYHIFLGILGIKHSKYQSIAKLIRNLSIVSILISIIILSYFTFVYDLRYFDTSIHLVPTICIINSALFCVGANKNYHNFPRSL